MEGQFWRKFTKTHKVQVTVLWAAHLTQVQSGATAAATATASGRELPPRPGFYRYHFNVM